MDVRIDPIALAKVAALVAVTEPSYIEWLPDGDVRFVWAGCEQVYINDDHLKELPNSELLRMIME